MDEYYWLRDDSRSQPEVLDYLHAENAYADAMLSRIGPLKDRLEAEIIGRIREDDSTVPYLDRGAWYYSRYAVGAEYPVHVRRSGSLDAAEEVLLDEAAMAAGLDFFDVGSFEVSPDDRLLAWTEDRTGRRQYTLRIRDLQTGRALPDVIGNVEEEILWTADGHSLLYIEKDPRTLLGRRVRRHFLGTDPAADPVIYEELDDSFFLSLGQTKDDRYLLIHSDSTVTSEVRYARADDPALRFEALLSRERGHEYEAEHVEGRWIIRSNWQALNFRLLEAPVGRSADRASWKEIVPHRTEVFLAGFDVFRGFLALEERIGGLPKLRVRSWSGDQDHYIESGEAAYQATLADNEDPASAVLRYCYTSLTTPLSTYDYDFATGERRLLKQEPVLGGFDACQYVTEYLHAPARDGQRIPVALVYRKDFRRDGSAPLFQYGYGAYGISTDPVFVSHRLSLIDRGFVVALAQIRGGQELGRRWYDDGRLLRKRNSFNDFIDVTRFLAREGYADPARIFASGRSAGGLLVAGVANMAPADYRAITTHVPFVDVVTTMLDTSIPLTTNEYDEWGNPEQQEYYDYMLSYSPYDGVSRQDYPALYVSAGLWDSQVQYFEPAKWVARLRRLKTDSNPLLFRINMDAGHSGKSGRFERYREFAEEYAFVLDQAGIRE